MVFYHPKRNVGAMLILHVDDVMLVTDGSSVAQAWSIDFISVSLLVNGKRPALMSH